MKKLYITALLAMAAAMPSQAKIFKWGVEGGVNMSKMNVEGAFSSDNRTGWFFGPKAQIAVPGVGIILDGSLQYSQSSMDVSNKTDSKTKTLPYVVVPINVKYAIGLGSYASVYVSTGPQWNWYVGDNSFSMPNYEGVLERNTFAWNFGVGAHLLQHLQVGINYNLGFGKSFADVKEQKGASLVDAGTWKNNQWQFRVAYMF